MLAEEVSYAKWTGKKLQAVRNARRLHHQPVLERSWLENEVRLPGRVSWQSVVSPFQG